MTRTCPAKAGQGISAGKGWRFSGAAPRSPGKATAVSAYKGKGRQGGNRMMREGNLTEKEEGNHHGRE